MEGHISSSAPSESEGSSCVKEAQDYLPDVAGFIFANSRVLYWGPYAVNDEDPKCSDAKTLGSLYAKGNGSTSCEASLFETLAAREFSEAEVQALLRRISGSSIRELVNWGLTPSVFSQILEQNVLVAAWLLSRIIDTPDDALYLTQLLCQSSQNTMRLLKSLRVVSDILSEKGAPSPTACCATCELIIEPVQRTILKPTDDIVAEVQSFTVTWIRLKEAGDLFRALCRSNRAQQQ